MKKLQKVIILGDPGLDGATALSLALADPNLEVLAALACAGNVSAEQATRNMQAVLARLDPPRWPRLGVAPVVDYDVDGRFWHGANGMVGLELPSAPPLNAPSSDKLLIELARKFPGEISLLNMGPCTVLAQALDREPALVDLLQNVGALLALVRPDGCKMRSIPVDIETQGEITKGMSIFDTRRNNHGGKANINVILQIESAVFEQYFNDLIRH